MAEYIEREAFIKRLENEADKSSDIINLLILNGIANIVRDKNIAPDVNVVEVVRCKECVHYNTSSCADGFGWCNWYDNGQISNNFCSFGERSSDNV